MSKYTIGIDLGGTTMTAGLVNEKFEVVGKVTWATRLPARRRILRRLWQTCAALWRARIRWTLRTSAMSASAPRAA